MSWHHVDNYLIRTLPQVGVAFRRNMVFKLKSNPGINVCLHQLIGFCSTPHCCKDSAQQPSHQTDCTAWWALSRGVHQNSWLEWLWPLPDKELLFCPLGVVQMVTVTGPVKTSLDFWTALGFVLICRTATPSLPPLHYAELGLNDMSVLAGIWNYQIAYIQRCVCTG